MHSDLGVKLDPCILILLQGDFFLHADFLDSPLFFIWYCWFHWKKKQFFKKLRNYEELSYTLKTTLYCEEGALNGKSGEVQQKGDEMLQE